VGQDQFTFDPIQEAIHKVTKKTSTPGTGRSGRPRQDSLGKVKGDNLVLACFEGFQQGPAGCTLPQMPISFQAVSFRQRPCLVLFQPPFTS